MFALRGSTALCIIGYRQVFSGSAIATSTARSNVTIGPALVKIFLSCGLAAFSAPSHPQRLLAGGSARALFCQSLDNGSGMRQQPPESGDQRRNGNCRGNPKQPKSAPLTKNDSVVTQDLFPRGFVSFSV